MRPLRITEDMTENIITEIKQTIEGYNLTTDKLNYNVDLKKYCKQDEKQRITIYFTADAFLKQRTLVQECTQEVGWHGTVTRLSDSEFIIDEILVFPQIVSGTDVTPDETEYANWLMQFFTDDEDTTIERMRFHGHSHVNMGVTPSGTDTNYQNNMLAHIRDFYIFMILNKKSEMNVMIYDITNNTFYDKDDVDYRIILNNGTNLREWYDENNELIKTRGYSSHFTTTADTKNKNNRERNIYYDEKLGVYVETSASGRKLYTITDPTLPFEQRAPFYNTPEGAKKFESK